MNKIKFVFGIHNHQPIGNFEFVFEDAYQKAYLPFLEVLEKHPKIRIALHFTGILLDWIAEHHPELIDKIKMMTERGQLEMMTGAYYEPIITVIPKKDRIGQIKKLTNRVKDMFGYDASGMWLAERIWEPTLPESLHDAGIKYSVIDDTHFKYAGLTEEDLTGYFGSEEMGKCVNLFPISKKLRYTIPFQHPDETIKHLQKMASEDGQTIIVFADDGEKFGVWPDTFRHVYENGWLEQFFQTIEQNLDWIEMIHFDEAIQQVLPKDNIYLPTASYAEMMQWSLFPKTYHRFETFEHLLEEQGLLDQYGIFVRGGFWRNFMVKYPEVNVMHKKMLRISRKLWEAAEQNGDDIGTALDHLWAGQCNCPYWHGVFGGLYLGHLRHAIYYNLIMAENAWETMAKPDLPVIEITDFDMDGRKEALVETAFQNAYFRLQEGGVMFEYDVKQAGKNLLDTMSRREEGYHKDLQHAKVVGEQPEEPQETASIHDLVLAKEPNLQDHLNYDWYQKKSFIDHIFAEDARLEDFAAARYEERGDFVNRPYELKKKERLNDRVILTLSREGAVWTEGRQRALHIEKELTIFNDTGLIEARYRLRNPQDEALQLVFGVEFNFGLQAGHSDDRYYYLEDGPLENAYLDSRGILSNQSLIGLRDEYMRLDIQLQADQDATVWRTPVETISLSEAGFERGYQSSTVVFVWAANVQTEWSVKLDHRVQRIEQ